MCIRDSCSSSKDLSVDTCARSRTAELRTGAELCLMLPQVAGIPRMRLTKERRLASKALVSEG
eukprot:10395479-Alexandrium_andersonii.AAC.1